MHPNEPNSAQQGLRRFARDAAWAFASLAVAAGIHFILRSFLARYYGPSDLGLYTLAFTVYALGLNFSGFGTGAGLVKYVAESEGDPTRTSGLLTSGMAISILSGFAFGSAFYFASQTIAEGFFKIPELTVPLRIVSISFPFMAIEKAALGFLNGTRQMRRFAFVNIVQNVLVVALTIAFALTGHSVRYAVFGLVLPMIVMSAVSVLLVARHISFSALFLSGRSSKVTMALMTFGFYVVLSAAVSTVQSYASTTLLGHFKTGVEVGLFGVVQTIMPALSLPSDAVQAITTPMIATYWGKGDIVAIEQLVNRAMKWIALYAVTAAFVLVVLGEQILTLVFGPGFRLASFPLQIMAFSGVLGAMLGAVGGALSSTRYVRLVFRISAITLALNVVLNLILIPGLGVLGAAVATSISMSVYSMIHIYFIQRLVGIKIDRIWFVEVVALAGMLATGTYVLGKVSNPYLSAGVALVLLVFILLRVFVPQSERSYLMKTFVRRSSRKQNQDKAREVGR